MPRRWMPAAANTASTFARSITAASTALRVGSGTMKKFEPQLTSCPGARVSSASTPSAAASAVLSVTVFPNVGFNCVIQANASRPSFQSRSRLIGPTPSPNVVRAVPGFSTPACASANAVPIVGCPANGVSAVRVKMRTR